MKNSDDQPSPEKSTLSYKKRTSSCMKHKKKDKNGEKYSNCDNHYTEHSRTESSRAVSMVNVKNDNTHILSKQAKRQKLALPKKPQEFSCNWKQFLKTEKLLQKPRKTDVKTSTGEEKNSSHRLKKKRLRIATERRNVLSNKAKSLKKPDIWFDGVDDILLDQAAVSAVVNVEKPCPKRQTLEEGKYDGGQNPLVKPQSFAGLTKHVAMDCEMVGVGHDAKESILARVSLVNHFGQCVYDKFVKPTEEVTDYRTFVSGVTCSDMEKGEEFSVVQQEVHDIVKDRILVGHALTNDLKVLLLSHARHQIRDTCGYQPFRQLFGGRTPSLKKLSQQLLGVKVQTGQHSSVQDAQAAMRLYTMYRKPWEKHLKEKRQKHRARGKQRMNTEETNSDNDSEGSDAKSDS